MSIVQNAVITILPIFFDQNLRYLIKEEDVRYRRYDTPAGRKVFATLFQNSTRIRQVFQHIVKNDTVELSALKLWRVRVKAAAYDVVQFFRRLIGSQLRRFNSPDDRVRPFVFN